MLPEFWRNDLTPVPAISDQGTRAQYIHDIVFSKLCGFLTMDSLLRQHPYLLWHVPQSLYHHSLSSYQPDQQVIKALEDALQQSHLWHQGEHVMQAIWAALRAALHDQHVDKLTVYKTLRLIGAGAHDVASQSSSRMFTILGRNEWQLRTDTVKKLLGNTETKETTV